MEEKEKATGSSFVPQAVLSIPGTDVHFAPREGQTPKELKDLLTQISPQTHFTLSGNKTIHSVIVQAYKCPVEMDKVCMEVTDVDETKYFLAEDPLFIEWIREIDCK